MKVTLWALLCLTAISVHSQVKWKSTTYSVTFKIRHIAGASAEGKFTGLKTNIILDNNKLEESTIFATLDASSFFTGNGARDKTMIGEEYFDVNKYPLITIKSVKIISKGGDNYEGIFKLTIKNITREIPLKFTLTRNASKGIFNTQLTINRLDYGIGKKSWMLANEAIVNIIVNTENE